MWKMLHPASPLEDIDSAFNTQCDESKHAAKLATQLKFYHPPLRQQRALHALIKDMLPVFDDLGVIQPVKNYECSIDTGTHPPIAYRGVTYGPHKTPTVESAINKLLTLAQICQVFFDG